MPLDLPHHGRKESGPGFAQPFPKARVKNGHEKKCPRRGAGSVLSLVYLSMTLVLLVFLVLPRDTA